MLRPRLGDMSARDSTHILPVSEIQGSQRTSVRNYSLGQNMVRLKPSLNNPRYGARCTLRFMLPLTGCLLAELTVSPVQAGAQI
jgi:hypothetical protein